MIDAKNADVKEIISLCGRTITPNVLRKKFLLLVSKNEEY